MEGDSAGGSAKTARDRMYQAILPIRGKILNVEKASIDKVLANAEIKTMINALAVDFPRATAMILILTKLRYDKIIIMADADGGRRTHFHIASDVVLPLYAGAYWEDMSILPCHRFISYAEERRGRVSVR